MKDEDELDAAMRAGRVTREQAAAIRAEGERVWRERPWPTGWEDWRPPAAWTIPELRAGWNALLETERLRLVPLGNEHAVFHDAAECHASKEHWERHGFGPWAVLEGDEFAGVAEVHYADPGVEGISIGEVEVGWSIVPARRGRGLATEALHAALDDAWTRTRADHVVASIRPGNVPSHRVAEKLGLTVRGPGLTRSRDSMTVYELRKGV